MWSFILIEFIILFFYTTITTTFTTTVSNIITILLLIWLLMISVKGDRQRKSLDTFLRIDTPFADLWASWPRGKKKAYTKSKTNKHLTLSYKNYPQKCGLPL